MMMNKYKNNIPNNILHSDFLRLMNQLWKLIPMRENGENWERQLSMVTIEIAGLGELFGNYLDFTVLLSKLEGLLIEKNNIDFLDYRKTVFDSINLLKRLENE